MDVAPGTSPGRPPKVPHNLASVRRATAVNIIDAWQGTATHGERYQDLWPR
jgi:hypothetical protein